MKKFLVSMSAAFLLSACATSTVTGQKRAPIAKEQVKVWFSGRPACNLAEIGFLSVPYAIGQNMLVSKLQAEAASIGAEHVLVTAVNSNRNIEYSGGAVAAVCQ